MHDETRSFLALLVAGDRRAAESLAHQVFESNGVRYLYEEVVQPALEEVGNLWSSNRITIANEHLATATARAAVAALYPQFPWRVPGPPMLIACAPGEHHDFGARLVADLLALDGWNERFLGANVGLEILEREVQAFTPRVVAISVTLPANVPMVNLAIPLVRRVLPTVKVLVGGRATTEHVRVYQTLGADGFARSGSEAVEVARGWK